MSEQTYAAMRAFIQVAVELEVKKLGEQIRSTIPTETRSAEPVVGKDGKDGEPGKDGKDGLNGKDGKDGANGIATREELDAWFEERASDLQARSLADAYQGTFDQAKTYARGNLVSWDGQPWLAMVKTRAIPGVSSDWKLFAKKGRDGRDRPK